MRGECRDYHALWPYRRLARIIIGLEADADTLQPLLDAAFPAGGSVLIIGAADAGLLALTLSAMRGRPAQISVVDRCATTLAICRDYAYARRLQIRTNHVDVTRELPNGCYDAVFAHGFLRFVPEGARLRLFRSLASVLAPRGKLIVSEMLPRAPGPRARDGNYADDLISGLEKAGMGAPGKWRAVPA